MNSKVSIRELAREAGVSISTVSRYLKGELAIKSETRKRIQEAAWAIGYPLPTGAPSHGRRTIGLIVPNLSNLFYGTLVDAIVQAAHLAGYRIIVESTHDSPQRQMDYVANFRDYPVDGILYCGHTSENDVLRRYAESGGRVVLVDEDVPDIENVSRVFVDNYGGMVQEVRYLLQCGHRHIGYIGGPVGLMTADYRLKGFHDEMREWGLTVDPRLVISGEFSPEMGMKAAAELFARKVSAIVAADDMVAVGVLQYCHMHGISVPDGLSLVGFDDIALASLLMPPLTTVHQPIETLGRRAVETLLRQMEDPTRELVTEILPVSLVVRQSVQAWDPVSLDL